ncbi:hypothetical protein NE237_006842 [Protea cynaroides]|uniref:protein-L-isoaspartate(D-aspartate) O-methyltransferase n=1 Tax=Protea cynaroides TaxID=273540 RepID=A0A9Q0KN13_9MAGN|nr:hypothetical protein NE237_006842 [Protea cynaroides]
MIAYSCRYCAPLKNLVSFSLLYQRRPPLLFRTLSAHLNPSLSPPPIPRFCTGNFHFLPMEQFWTKGSSDKNKALVEQLQQYGVIKSNKVAEVVQTIDRGLFVPDGIPAYVDSPMQIGYNATISAPHMHAMCLELLENNLQPGMHALDVGSGTGYLTACFAMMVGPQGRAVGVEHIPELVTTSIKNIQKSQAAPLLNGGSLSIHGGDGRLGWPEFAPYDAIHVGAAAAEIPQPLIDQLKPGGRMVIPVGNLFQDLKVVDKKLDGSISIRTETSVRYVPLTSREAQLRVILCFNINKQSVSSLMMSEASVPHAEHKGAGPNYFGYHIREIVELLSQNEEFIAPFSSQTHELSATCAKVTAEGIRHECGRKSNNSAASSSLFCDGIGDGLSDFKRERLKASLKESVLSLNQEVDEMVGPVMAMCKIKAHLREKEGLASRSSASNVDFSLPLCKKQKKSSSPSLIGSKMPAETEGYGGESESKKMNVSDQYFVPVSSDESQLNKMKKRCGRCCANCQTERTPQWRVGPDGHKSLCNACGIRYKKEGELPLALNEIDGKEEKCEVDDDLRVILENGGLEVEETVKKYSDELFAELGNMEQQLEELLHVVMSKSRSMTITEKQELRKLIQELPPKNLDRIVEIVLCKRPQDCHPCNEVYIDLEEEDNVTLWRLYYYVQAVARARKLAS